ncbi:MAG TPA: trypsin-like peptidase domain-containing protein [Pseudobacteroides sp.]|uniref:S1C family serine protease n=1 Tax=Pseudobacteroides sp. TaxID=1968840 RepID=UPI002F94D179
MDKNYGWNIEEKNNLDETEQSNTDGLYDSTGKKIKNKFNLKKYISLVLVSSTISSALVGWGLYSKFSDELSKQAALYQKYQTTNVMTDNAGNIKYEKVALTKGSPVTEIAKKVNPSIVGIRMVTGNSKRSYFNNISQSNAEGSGVIISQDGYIMTNYHVVQYADPKNRLSRSTTLEVFLSDDKQVKAKYIGGDSKNDLAVIKVELDNLPAAELGDSSQLEVGELAVAIGNPLGMEFAGSVTVGVVSALDRKVEAEGKTLNLIQTDAASNPGNSGGALVNSQGQVIGINTIKISTAGVEGLGFAIPINDAKPIVDQLRMFGYIKGRPQIGITGEQVTEPIAQQYGIPVGIYIIEVASGSGADKAGISEGDILVSLADKEVKTMKDLDDIKKSYKAGDTVNAVVVRDGSKVDLKLTFTEEK